MTITDDGIRIGGGLGASSIVGIIFVIGKVFGFLNWSWLWVLCPFWIPAALALVIMLVCVIIAIVVING